MRTVAKWLKVAWLDSRAAVYAVAAAAVLAGWGAVRVHGFPKTHADWTVLGWTALAAGIGASARAVDPLVARIASAAAKVSRGGQVVSQAELQALVQAELARAQAAAAEQAKSPTPDGA